MSEIYFHCEAPQGVRQNWSLSLPKYTAGRGAGTPADGHLCLSGDNLISRLHFEIQPQKNTLQVRRLESGRNPLFFKGQECDEFTLPLGESFVVGQTRCSIALGGDSLGPGTTEFTLFGKDRDEARQRGSYECFQALLTMLPGLRRATDENTVWTMALDVLRRLLPEASTLMVLKGPEMILSHPPHSPVMASRRLLARAHQEKCTITQVWDGTTASEATVLDQVAWAVAAPADEFTLYAVGGSSPDDLRTRAALVDVVAETVAHYLSMHQFQRLQSQVGQFFSPVLRQMLSEADFQEALRPRQAMVTVLFFDLRGFSQATEAAEQDSLDEILHHHESLTEVMTAVTQCIFERDGVVIDYQGDAVLACWGVPKAQPDHAARAVDAARAILAQVYAMDLPFMIQKGKRNLRCGLGLGTGEVIAGQIGARDQTKFGVMGKVVNHASRLEGLTKQLGVPMLINAELFRQLPPEQGVLCRCVGKVRPAGVKEAHEIYEVVVPADQGGSGLKPDEAQAYEQAYKAYLEGHFLAALSLLRQVPVDDPIGTFLMRQVLARQDEDLPEDWDGVLEFRSK